MYQLQVFEDAHELARRAAEALVEIAGDACRERGRFVWCVSGGQTPRALYETLASPALASRIDWNRTHIAFGDERCVAADDPASNYRMLRETLLQHVAIPQAQVHRIATERLPPSAAVAYQATLQDLLGTSASGAPREPFDLVLLGLGADGHTASLFPNSVDEAATWVSAREAQPLWRVTLTPLVLNATRSAWFLVSGADKAERLAEVLQGPTRPLALPAQRIAPQGSLCWWVDRAAAARLARR